MKHCEYCVHAKWAMTTNGRRHPSGDGVCTKVVKIPPLPASRYWAGMTEPISSGGHINRRTELKSHCVYFAREESK